MFSFLHSKKQKLPDGVVAIFDIGSASVGGALVRLSKSKKPKILYSTRKLIPIQENLNEEKFTKAMIHTLDIIVSRMEKKGLVHLNFLKMENKGIKSAFCFVSSPWHVSQTKNVKIEKPEPFVVTEDLIESMIQEEEDEFIENDTQDYLQEFGQTKGVNIMDKKIIQIRLNGYIVNSPWKKKVKNIETSIFMSLITQDITDRIKNSITKAFHLEDFHIHSFTLASFLSLRDIFKSEEDFLFIDVNGEMTDISIVRDDVLRETHTFPIGRNSFIRDVMKNTGGTYQTTVSSLSSYWEGGVTDEAKFKIDDAIDDSKKEWVKALEGGLLDLSHGGLLPRNIFVMANDDIGRILNKSIKNERFSKLVFPGYNKTSNPVLINSSKIDDFCGFGKGVDRDVFLGIETIFIKKLLDL